MKSIKVFGFAVLAATTMVLAGASSAAAEPTALCAEEPVVEEGIEQCPAVSHLEAASIKKAKLLTSVTTVECDVSFLATETGDKPIVFTGNFTYSNCGSCEIAEENGPSTIELLWNSHEHATVTGKSLLRVKCGAFINCKLTESGLKGTLVGALLATNKTGEISFEKQKLASEGGALCPSQATLDLEMKLSSSAYLVTLSLVEMNCKKVWFGFFLTNPDGKRCKESDFPLLPGEFELGWLIL